MAISRSDISFQKSQTITDTNTNGGRMSYIEIPNRTKYNLFPRVTKPERDSGITRYRKEFIWNKNADNETAFGVLAYLLFPSPANDRFYIAEGTQTDVQGDIDSSYKWYSGGKLNEDVTAGSKQIKILFENNDVYVDNDLTIAISSEFKINQSVDSNVKPFDPVKYDDTKSKWVKQSAPSEDQEDQYPYGTYLGNNIVFTYHADGHIEYVKTANDGYEDEQLSGSGTGPYTGQNGGKLLHPPIKKESVKVKYIIASLQYEASDDGNGNITGNHINNGTIDYETGSISITFDAEPDTVPTVDYYQRCYTWSGNVCTINLQDQLANNYDADNTYCGVCLSLGDIKPSLSDKQVVSSNGQFDESKVSLDNQGTVEDTWTLTFTDATHFTCSGTYEGNVGTGTVTSNFSPTNPNTSKPYFTIDASAWSGNFAQNDKVIFKTHPAAKPIWMKEVVPAGCAAYSNNGTLMELYIE